MGLPFIIALRCLTYRWLLVLLPVPRLELEAWILCDRGTQRELMAECPRYKEQEDTAGDL